MKPVQFTIDEPLLRELDRDPEVKRAGRSAVVRNAIRQYLERRRNAEIAAAYRRAYGDKPLTAREREDLSAMIDSQAWPDE